MGRREKAFYSDMYAFEEGEWRYVGALAEPLAYGMTAPVGSDRILLIGGAGYNGSVGQVTAVARDEKGSWRQTAMPSLPVAIQEGAAASAGSIVYVAGGVADGKPSSSLMALDIADTDKGWQTLAPMPEPLVQPVMVSVGGRLYLWEGVIRLRVRCRVVDICMIRRQTAGTRLPDIRPAARLPEQPLWHCRRPCDVPRRCGS